MTDETLKLFGEIIHRDVNRIAERIRNLRIYLYHTAGHFVSPYRLRHRL